jgi:hypothetical protein
VCKDDITHKSRRDGWWDASICHVCASFLSLSLSLSLCVHFMSVIICLCQCVRFFIVMCVLRCFAARPQTESAIVTCADWLKLTVTTKLLANMFAFVSSVVHSLFCQHRNPASVPSESQGSEFVQWVSYQSAEHQWHRIVTRYLNFSKIRTDWGLLGHWLQNQKRLAALAAVRGASLVIHPPSNPRRF